jgi:hypothetical protein
MRFLPNSIFGLFGGYLAPIARVSLVRFLSNGHLQAVYRTTPSVQDPFLRWSVISGQWPVAGKVIGRQLQLATSSGR